VIVEVNGKPIDDQRTLRLMVSSMPPRAQIGLRVLRAGQSRNMTLTLGELPVKETASAESSTRQKPSAPDTTQPHLGIAVMEITPDIAEHLQLPSTVKGVVIGDIEPGSAAAEAGLQVGDVIQEVNRKPVRTVNDFRSEISTRSSDPTLLRVNREGHTLFFALKPR
jgi:serine protease Do